MIDNLVIYIKNIPHLFKYSLKRLSETWKWFAFLLLFGGILVFLTIGIMNFLKIEEIYKARVLYRLSSLITFITYLVMLFKSFKEYKNDYWIAKPFNLSPIVTTIINSFCGSIVLYVLLILITLFVPVNVETSYLALTYYILMIFISMVILAVFFGLLNVVSKRIRYIFFIGSLISIFIVPILFIPNANGSMIQHILMLHPLFYLVDGISSSIIFGISSMNNIPYHIYFIIFMAIIMTINYWYHRHIAQAKYNYKHADRDKTKVTTN